MNKREIRHQRRKDFFINAAMEVLKTGDENLINAKEIAYRAGYSASSIYDYFSNLDDLLMKCVDEYMEEIDILMKKEIDKTKFTSDKIKVSYIVYTKYFLDNPLLFKTIFMSKTSKARFSTDVSLMPKFYKMGIERLKTLEEFEKKLSLKKGAGALIEKTLTPNMFGILYMYFFGIYEYSTEELLRIFESTIDNFLKPYKEIELIKYKQNDQEEI